MTGENLNSTPIFFGPAQVVPIPLFSLNELPQVRSRYGKEALEDLATSMIKNPDIEEKTDDITSDDFQMVTSLSVGIHGKKSAFKYINDHGEYYRIAKKDRVDVADLKPLTDDSAAISIAGHRRTHAAKLLVQRFGLSLDLATISSIAHYDIRFVDAQLIQLRENVYDKPPAYDEARSISLFYKDIVSQTGRAPSIAHFSRQLGYSETKVRDALAFSTLPARIQAYTEDGLLSYLTVRRLKTLSDAYHRYYAHLKDPIAIEKSVEDELVIFCHQMITMDLKANTEQRRAQLIENKAKEIFGQAEYQQEGLFFLEAAMPYARRKTSTEQLSRLAFDVIAHQIRQAELSLGALGELQAALDTARKLATSRNVLLDTFDQQAS